MVDLRSRPYEDALGWYDVGKMIGLMDCNNFFVSCERLFRPDLAKKPVLVLSSNDGCVVSRSQEVKDLGIPMGVPHFQIKDICAKEKITVFSSNFTLYRDISRRVMSALRSEFSHCEVYSIDEAFFEVPDSLCEQDIHDIRTKIIQKTGIPVSIGIAQTKTLAKVGSIIAKKGKGVHILSPELWKETAKTTSCGSIWGIGRQTSAALSRMKIYTVSELLEKDATFFKNSFGVIGERLMLELKGVPVYQIGEGRIEPQDSYTSSRSFGMPVRDKETLNEAFRHHVSHLAQKLRSDGNTTSYITILVKSKKIGTEMLYTRTRAMSLYHPTNETITLLKEVNTLIDQLYNPTDIYKKAGVIMSRIQPFDQSTGSLFSTESILKKTHAIHKVADALNDKFGSGVVHFGGVSTHTGWHDKKGYVSKHYTTQWSEIPTVKAIEDMSYINVRDN